IASVAIPISKFAAVAYLALSVGKGGAAHRRMHLLEAVEYIGRWSMIDVFVVAIMASLVQLGAAVSITPGPAALSFAACVVFTMLAARAFDSRLIWGAVLGDKVVKT
ncbi:MAG: paraquat-inducible protein A, partial [Rhodobacteraceae bacterium]|nr:paraquat-inducible protein A [Paracoccaceae bacterium]